MILLVDNYDSFTWNLRHALVIHDAVEVVRNDGLSVADALALKPDAIVLGPGPGRPIDAGITPQLLTELPADIPLLGVCLGHQALVEFCGGSLERDPAPTHGKASAVIHEGGGLFAGMASPVPAGRYHSLRVQRSLPESLVLDAWTEDGIVMGVHHMKRPWFGLQFHPESILTPDGGSLVANFLRCRP